jgi:hypothetical protein
MMRAAGRALTVTAGIVLAGAFLVGSVKLTGLLIGFIALMVFAWLLRKGGNR